MTMSDRRAVPRQPARLTLALRVGDGYEPLQSRDVSATGAFVVCKASRRAGEILQLQHRPEHPELRVDVRALVVRVAEPAAADFGMGVVWLDARSTSTTAITGFLRESLGLGPGAIAAISGNVYIFEAARQLLGSLHSGGHAPQPAQALGRHAPSGRTEVVGFRAAMGSQASAVAPADTPAVPTMPAFAPRAPTPAQPLRAVPQGRVSSAATPIALGAGPVVAPAADVAESLPRSPRLDPHGRDKRTTSPERGKVRADRTADPQGVEPRSAEHDAPGPARRAMPFVSDDALRQRALIGTRPRVAAPSHASSGHAEPVRAVGRPPSEVVAAHVAAEPTRQAAHASESGVFRALRTFTGKLRGRSDGPVPLGKMAVSPDGRFYTAGHGAIPDGGEPLESTNTDDDEG